MLATTEGAARETVVPRLSDPATMTAWLTPTSLAKAQDHAVRLVEALRGAAHQGPTARLVVAHHHVVYPEVPLDAGLGLDLHRRGGVVGLQGERAWEHFALETEAQVPAPTVRPKRNDVLTPGHLTALGLVTMMNHQRAKTLSAETDFRLQSND